MLAKRGDGSSPRTRLLLVGAALPLPDEAFSPVAIEPILLEARPDRLGEALADPGAPIIVALRTAGLTPEHWREALTQARRFAAVATLDGDPAPWSEFSDCHLPSEDFQPCAPTLMALNALAETRRRAQTSDSLRRRLTESVRLLDQIPEAIVGTDLSGVVRSWNGAAESLFGYTRGQAVGQSLDFFIAAGQQTPFRLHKLLEPLLINHRHTVELEIQRPDGASLPVHMALSLERNEQSDIVGVICCCRDISKRRRAEGEKHAAYQRLTFFIERMPLGFIEWDLYGNIRAWNRQSEIIFGYSLREALGQSFALIVEPDFVRECQRIFQLVQDGKGGYRSRNANVTKDGRRIICEWNNALLLDEHDNVLGYASIVDDVTERIRTEEELKRSKETALAANRSKDEFLAVMSHEVRTPMNSIIGFADLLLDSEPEESQTELINIIKANAFNLLEMINNVLNYSRLEAGDVTLRVQDTDLPSLLHEIEEVVSAEALDKGLDFVAELSPELPTHIMADHLELRQVLLNLTANALKFTEKGSIRVSVEGNPAGPAQPGQWELLFSVRDTGVGIRDEDKFKLFQSFTQLDSSSTRRFGGTGLGLAICRRIVELWRGRIWAENNEGPGATFHFTLNARACDDDGDDGDPRRIYDEIDDERFAEIFPLRILLISPDADTGEILERILCNLGYPLRVERETIDAISYLQDNVCEIILMDDRCDDFTLPEMRTVIASGQTGEANRGAQLVALQERGPEHKDDEDHTLPDIERLGKPVNPRQVRALLRKLAIQGGQSTSPPRP